MFVLILTTTKLFRFKVYLSFLSHMFQLYRKIEVLHILLKRMYFSLQIINAHEATDTIQKTLSPSAVSMSARKQQQQHNTTVFNIKY